MIGIDITRISRFKEFGNLPRFLARFNVDGNDAMAAAKTWACYEAIIKAEGSAIDCKKIRILFPKNQRPEVVDEEKILSGTYALTLSHEGDVVVAVALRENKY